MQKNVCENNTLFFQKKKKKKNCDSIPIIVIYFLNGIVPIRKPNGALKFKVKIMRHFLHCMS
jgi:hypothetical protein